MPIDPRLVKCTETTNVLRFYRWPHGAPAPLLQAMRQKVRREEFRTKSFKSQEMFMLFILHVQCLIITLKSHQFRISWFFNKFPRKIMFFLRCLSQHKADRITTLLLLIVLDQKVVQASIRIQRFFESFGRFNADAYCFVRSPGDGNL